jgi:hypothetical protein
MTSETAKARFELLEADKNKLEVLRATLAEGETQLSSGERIDGEVFMQELIKEYE